MEKRTMRHQETLPTGQRIEVEMEMEVFVEITPEPPRRMVRVPKKRKKTEKV